MKGINSRHRKHYKAGSVWKPGEQQAAQEKANTWAKRVMEFLKARARGKTF